MRVWVWGVRGRGRRRRALVWMVGISLRLRFLPSARQCFLASTQQVGRLPGPETAPAVPRARGPRPFFFEGLNLQPALWQTPAASFLPGPERWGSENRALPGRGHVLGLLPRGVRRSLGPLAPSS